jgi:hypothetical protein
MTTHRTTFDDRQRFVQQHALGESYAAIAQASGWQAETVRQHCEAVQRTGVTALQPRLPGPPPRGVLSTFAPVVRFAALRLKRLHPAWGPAVILDELCERPSTRRTRLPHVSQLAAYFHQFGARLIQPRRHLQLPAAEAVLPEPVARVFQLDMQERLYLAPLGYFNVLNIRAPQWGLTVGCYPHPAGRKRWACKVSQAQARDDCRHTFELWGLPDVVQTDRDKVLVASGDYPFPSFFTLWLVGLDIQHRLIQRVIQNGSVERCHRTFDKQMLSGCTASDWPTFLQYVDQEVVRLNERLPSRARACRGAVPLAAHPEALIPRRVYTATRETELFELTRVYTYLAQGRWVRQASTHGQLSFADQIWNAGHRFEDHPVVITFLAETHDFLISTPEGSAIKRMPSSWITEAAIRGVSMP